MSILVVKFLREGFKIRLILGQKLMWLKDLIVFHSAGKSKILKIWLSKSII